MTTETDAIEGTPEPRREAAVILGPDEIVNYQLGSARKGYVVEEVNDLLDQLAAQTRDLMTALRAAAQERDSLRTRLEDATETESTLKRTLITAQRAAEHSIEEAREQAELIRQRATERAEALLATAADQAHELRDSAMRRARADEADGRRRRRDLEEHIERLRTFAEDHESRLRHHLELQMERLGAMEVPSEPPPPIETVDQVVNEDLGMTVDVEAELAAVAASVDSETFPVEADPAPVVRDASTDVDRASGVAQGAGPDELTDEALFDV